MSQAVARALLAFSYVPLPNVAKPWLSVGIEKGQLCATDGVGLLRFEDGEREPGCPYPEKAERRYWPRGYVEAQLKAAGRSGVVTLSWERMLEGGLFPKVSEVEPQGGVRFTDAVMVDPALLGRLELVARACRRERRQGESITDSIPLPGVLLTSIATWTEPLRFQVGGPEALESQHVASVCIMPMRRRSDLAKKAPKVKPEVERGEVERRLSLVANEGKKADERTRLELSRLSLVKLGEAWSGRDAQKQVLSNVLRDREVSRAQRASIQEAMMGRALSDLRFVVAEVLG